MDQSQPDQPSETAQPTSPKQQLQPAGTATDYYNKKRKRSFLLSRVTVFFSLAILVIALGVNLYALAAPNNSTIQSHAYQANPRKNLPSLPAGCLYQQKAQGFAVVCPTGAPANTTSFPAGVVLPKLPPECNYQASASGSMIQCTTPHAPIPTSPVTAPANCITTPQANIMACKNNQDKIIAVPLPSLPGGCTYIQKANKDYISCKAK